MTEFRHVVTHVEEFRGNCGAGNDGQRQPRAKRLAEREDDEE